MKVVGLSGAQGAGKSTLLKALMSRGWELDQFRVSRAVQAQLGWDTLDQVMVSPSSMMTFQNEVYKQKYKNDHALKDQLTDRGYSIILTERTFADIVAYTAQWTWRFVDQGKLPMRDAMDFMVQFSHDCANAQEHLYTGTLLLPYMGHMIWEADANRAALKDVHTIFEDIERFLEMRLPLTHRRLKISAETVEARANQVEAFLETL